MILVSEVKKTFGEIRAVRNVSLEIAAGEVFGLLGPNGAGKTTLLSILMGLIRPDSGRVTISGGDPAQPAVRETIGLAPQSLSLYDEFTAWENLKFFARLYGLSGAPLRERIEWALDFASLAERRHDLVKTYSGGMKRRLNMALALIHDPQAILFDEPTVGVDPQSRNHIFDCIERLKQDGRTIIYTTHYMEEAQRLCDRVAIVDHGEILAIGAVDELLQQYGGQSAVYGQLDSDVVTDSCPGVGDDRRFHFRSENPLQDVLRMSGDGVTFRTLQISAPDLESVFLSLTGRTLRDD